MIYPLCISSFNALVTEVVPSLDKLVSPSIEYFQSSGKDKIVRAEITYTPTIPNAIESGATKNCDEYLDKFCEWIGFGCEENDEVELPKGFLPYEQ